MSNCNCNCNQPCGCDYGCGVVPGPYVSRHCSRTKVDLRIKTEVLPATVGTDEKGQPFAPKSGRYFNTIVQYQANGAVYFYDTSGIYTKMNGQIGDESSIEEIAAMLQENINQLANKEAIDVESLQTNINAEVNARSAENAALQKAIQDENVRAFNAEEAIINKVNEKQDTLVSEGEGQNIKTINGESLLGEGNLDIGNEGGATVAEYTLSAPQLNQLINANPTADYILIKGGVMEQSTKQGTHTDLFALQSATTSNAGLMSAADKTKLDSLSASTNLSSIPTAAYTADNVSLSFGDESVELTPAVGTAGGAVSKSGIMSAFQASQLEALAQAYEAEEKGTVLYEGSASVNNIELSESGLSYDHLIVVAQYMGMGSFALEQQVSEVFYPTDSVKSFQMNTTDITTGNTPMVQLIQDIWSITEDGMELELASSLKATVNSETTVEPDTTSNFTITKVVGFGKKLTTE